MHFNIILKPLEHGLKNKNLCYPTGSMVIAPSILDALRLLLIGTALGRVLKRLKTASAVQACKPLIDAGDIINVLAGL
jgi:hypothetical protein